VSGPSGEALWRDLQFLSVIIKGADTQVCVLRERHYITPYDSEAVTAYMCQQKPKKKSSKYACSSAACKL
jgi:hypothetical protein